jgi:hypothetical protein
MARLRRCAGSKTVVYKIGGTFYKLPFDVRSRDRRCVVKSALIILTGLAALAVVMLLTLSSASLQCGARSPLGPRIADAMRIKGCGR